MGKLDAGSAIMSLVNTKKEKEAREEGRKERDDCDYAQMVSWKSDNARVIHERFNSEKYKAMKIITT